MCRMCVNIQGSSNTVDPRRDLQIAVGALVELVLGRLKVVDHDHHSCHEWEDSKDVGEHAPVYKKLGHLVTRLA